MAQVKLYFI